LREKGLMVAFFQPGESRQVAVKLVRIGPRRAKRAAVSALCALVLLIALPAGVFRACASRHEFAEG
jgi:hypothetical protein